MSLALTIFDSAYKSLVLKQLVVVPNYDQEFSSFSYRVSLSFVPSRFTDEFIEVAYDFIKCTKCDDTKKLCFVYIFLFVLVLQSPLSPFLFRVPLPSSNFWLSRVLRQLHLIEVCVKPTQRIITDILIKLTSELVILDLLTLYYISISLSTLYHQR